MTEWQQITNVGKDGRKGNSRALLVEMEISKVLGKTAQKFLKKLNVSKELLYNPEIPLLGSFQKKTETEI